jgi:hypothetical protein
MKGGSFLLRSTGSPIIFIYSLGMVDPSGLMDGFSKRFLFTKNFFSSFSFIDLRNAGGEVVENTGY